ncbi:uncharacterized protein LOC143452897 [Clavelina lepadiformis]|uniref:uncharacterized protein LOC143452897 n=1 Tax=Clavelina lepadiformis TaxID=159417 RepID=UPI00404274DC
MDFDECCRRVFRNGSPLVDYVYVGTRRSKLKDLTTNDSFLSLTVSEVSIITNSKNSNFVLRGEEYRFVNNVEEIFTYASPTRCLSYASTLELVVAACGPNGSFRHCQSAVQFGITWLEWFHPNGV